jgi:trehalose/maltose transport system permease protein
MRRVLRRAGLFALVFLAAIYVLFPFYYAVVSSLKSGTSLFIPEIWPSRVDVSNFVVVLADSRFVRNVLNSVIVATAVTLISLAVALTAAFALGRIRFRGRGTTMLTILSVSMFPQVAVLAGLFELIRALGLYNSLGGLILSNLILTLPFTVWVLTAFIKELPVELEEAAYVDGASPFAVLTRVFLPLMAPALVTTGLLTFIASWNEFLFALTFTLTDDVRTVPVAIATMSANSRHELPWGKIMAASVVVTVPVVLLVLVFQRRIVSGLVAGAVKG